LAAVAVAAVLAGLPSRAVAASTSPTIVPKPASLQVGSGRFELRPPARIVVADARALAVAEDLAADLRPATGYALPVVSGRARGGDLVLGLGINPGPTGEGYTVTTTPRAVVLRAGTAHGLFDAVQTLRQLLPASIASSVRQPGPWNLPAVRILDYPRYAYRGFMLDIARHYQSPATVERLISEVAAYKINVLHLHLGDDQGFRVVTDGFPRLTAIGGQGSVGTHGRRMDPGGYWTQAEYESVVADAAAHFVTVVPEVDSPGHDNAIIMSEYGDTANPLLDGHPQSIDCSRNNPPVWNYTLDVGYSALCPSSPDTWTILSAIVGQLSAISPGPYYDVGGDEVPSDLLSQAQYAAFLNREFGLVAAVGKTVMGWADIAGEGTTPPAGSLAEYWQPAAGTDPGGQTAREAVTKHLRLIMAPANHAYLDQKYIDLPDHVVPEDLGQNWACPTGCDVSAFYNWDPGHLVSGVSDHNVYGVEATLFGETTPTLRDLEFLAFPRLLAIAELGWSPYALRTPTSAADQDFLERLGAQGPRMRFAGIDFYRSPEVPWR
jgi:hexosaminidase